MNHLNRKEVELEALPNSKYTCPFNEGVVARDVSEDGTTAVDSLEKGLMQYGCQHYRRRCRFRAPCCNEIFDCPHCHNEAKNNINIDQKLRHDIPRHQIRQVICSLCGTEQEVQQVCFNCGVCMGKYFYGTCKLFDDDISKDQYHCNGCGICRIGRARQLFPMLQVCFCLNQEAISQSCRADTQSIPTA